MVHVAKVYIIWSSIRHSFLFENSVTNSVSHFKYSVLCNLCKQPGKSRWAETKVWQSHPRSTTTTKICLGWKRDHTLDQSVQQEIYSVQLNHRPSFDVKHHLLPWKSVHQLEILSLCGTPYLKVGQAFCTYFQMIGKVTLWYCSPLRNIWQ